MNLYLNRCVARVCCKSARHWLTAGPSNSTQIIDGRGVGYRDIRQLLCFTRMQAITADTVSTMTTSVERSDPAACYTIQYNKNI